MPADFWDDPEAGGDDSPVIRHAPDAHNYHYPQPDQTGKMPGGRVKRWATIPQANKNGTSKGFDATVAGPVHVDPDAPDGGVIFDPSEVRKSDINRAVAQSMYPHQAFYQLGTLAANLGIGKKASQNRNIGYGNHTGVDVDRTPQPMMGGAYVTPSAAPNGGGQQLPVPDYAAMGYGGGYQNQTPVYAAQEAQVMNPVPPLNSLPPIHMPGGVVPTQQPQHLPPPQQPLPQPSQQLPPPAQYPYPYPQPAPQYPYPYPPPPPAVDPNVQALMGVVSTLQQQMQSLVNNPPRMPATTGVSNTPLPKGAPLRTMPPGEDGRRRKAPTPQEEEDFDDTNARPIRKQVKRKKGSQEIVDEEESIEARRPPAEDAEEPQTLKQAREYQHEPEGIIYGFESLNLPFVTGPVPLKAKKKVVFEIPGAGKQMANFHHVIDAPHCVVLVYDTRYEDGQQYIPPELDDKIIKVHIPVPGKKGEKKPIEVSSMGFTYPFGVFDMIVLVKAGTKEVDYDGGADEDEDE